MRYRIHPIPVVLAQFSIIGMLCAQVGSIRPTVCKGALTVEAIERLPADSTTVNVLRSVDADDLEMSSRGGARVALHLRDGSVMYGDLLSVSDRSVSLYVYKNSSYAFSGALRSGVQAFNVPEIDKLVLKGRSRILQGIFAGFLGGMVAGTVVTRVAGWRTSGSDLAGPGALGGIGLVIGSTIGYLSSGNDVEISAFGEQERAILKSLCGGRKK